MTSWRAQSLLLNSCVKVRTEHTRTFSHSYSACISLHTHTHTELVAVRESNASTTHFSLRTIHVV